MYYDFCGCGELVIIMQMIPKKSLLVPTLRYNTNQQEELKGERWWRERREMMGGGARRGSDKQNLCTLRYLPAVICAFRGVLTQLSERLAFF
jgi:hypothetical protein